MARSARKYSWKPDIPDHRDRLFLSKVSHVGDLPPVVDLRPKMSPVEDQGELGSCTAQALVGALEFLQDQDGYYFKDMSRLFLYYNERKIEGSVDEDSGAQIRDGVKSLVETGCCTERLWPYDISQFKAKPSDIAYAEAKAYKATQYQRVIGLLHMRAALALGFPFVFGFSVYEAFEDEAVAKTGVLGMPGPNERLLGGHAVLCVGYNDNTRQVVVRNSWGAEWGQAGYFLMPYDYISNPQLADDMWVVQKVTNL